MNIGKGLLVGILSITMIVPVDAANMGNNSIPVTIDAEPSTFSVTVPTSLPIWVDTSGVVTTASDTKIVNNSVGPVEVVGVQISGRNNWKIDTYNQDYSTSEVGKQSIGLELNGDQTSITGFKFTQEKWPHIVSKSNLPLSYNATLPPQPSTIKEEVATIIFTIDWYKAPEPEGEPFQVTASNRHTIGFTGELNEDLVIPSKFTDETGTTYKVTSIGSSVFMDCVNLRSVDIPDSVVEIGDAAFRGCTSLERVNMPSNLVKIGSGAFYKCSALRSIEIPNKVEFIGDDAFRECSSLSGSITIPAGVKSLGKSAFAHCVVLSGIDIENGVETIGTASFQNCPALTELVIPESITTIGNFAFAYCSSLKSINIPDSVTSIGNFAFADLTSLTRLDVPSTVRTIGNDAFRGLAHVYYTGPATGTPWGAKAIN